MCNIQYVFKIKADMMCLKKEMIEIFHEQYDSSLCALKFHLLDNVVEDLKIFGNLTIPNASPFEHYNIHIKRSYRETSKQHSTRIY